MTKRVPTPRVALTPGCQISYMEHTGCRQLKRVLTHNNNAKSGNPRRRTPEIYEQQQQQQQQRQQPSSRPRGQPVRLDTRRPSHPLRTHRRRGNNNNNNNNSNNNSSSNSSSSNSNNNSKNSSRRRRRHRRRLDGPAPAASRQGRGAGHLAGLVRRGGAVHVAP
jgi:hypothetical protein